ncbi:Rrf2 family transcriptional regulator [Brevundimonas sp. PAMC22021]|uniref:Rrf2 family transcriptional regulator n=1 Tax=Brevundimonas sp. PAMC22021 TaxID=2861285 RepID=UPI001C634D18|nr:Rrf2 family transcriptional regulator [Brevundimonas sp. PAMC22021]QYF86965.1 Rrf2 family transcriptional regulator [Brevundimonas sp. PAMC22021]
MPTDTRLSRMLHVLIHMDHLAEPVTSDTISRMLDTNPVVVRRTMGSLKAAGYLTSVKGHGGGWTLARSLDELTLRDIHQALGSPKVFAIGLADDNPQCPVERAVNASIEEAMAEAERRLLERFGEVTIGSLSRDVAASREDLSHPIASS